MGRIVGLHRVRGWAGVVLVGLAAGCAVEGDGAPVATWESGGAPGLAHRYDLSCHGKPLPEKAARAAAVDGFTVDSYAFSGVGGAQVDLVRSADGAVLASATATELGRVSLEVPLEHAPMPSYFRMAKPGYVPSYLFPSGPVVEDARDVALPLIPPAWRDELAWYAGVELDPARGIVGVIVIDCAGERVEGATVTFDPPAEVVAYWDPTFTDASATRTTLNGHAWGFNLPAGEVRATVEIGGVVYRDWPVRSFADGRTLAWRAP